MKYIHINTKLHHFKPNHTKYNDCFLLSVRETTLFGCSASANCCTRSEAVLHNVLSDIFSDAGGYKLSTEQEWCENTSQMLQSAALFTVCAVLSLLLFSLFEC